MMRFILIIALHWAILANATTPECSIDSDCILVKNPACFGEYNIVSVSKGKPPEWDYQSCKKTSYEYSDTDKDKSLKPLCRNAKCTITWISKLTKVEILKKIDAAQSCQSKADCTGPIGKCPFGCNLFVNKNQLKFIKDLMAHYPDDCEYKCKSTEGFDCVKNRCTSAVTPGEIFSGSPCNNNIDCKQVYCGKFDGPIKSGYQPECLPIKNTNSPKECRCMCRGCE